MMFKKWAFALLLVVLFLPGTEIIFHKGLAALDCSDRAGVLRKLQTLAAKGNAKAQYELGLIYERGQCVPQDNTEAVKWFRKSAKQGHGDAQYSLGLSLALGQGTQIDEIEATKWFRMAAEQGHAMAQYSLGLRYADGRGVQKSFVQAYMWWSRAAMNGVENAALFRDRIAERMTRAQIVEAQKLVSEWLGKNKI